ncbi:MAG TPA: hypothetical protein VGB65_01285, partial [Allosphingosinicella sp.]
MTASPFVGYAEHALHAANRAADACPDRTTDDTADRACCAITFRRTLPGAADDTLRAGERRGGEKREE